MRFVYVHTRTGPLVIVRAIASLRPAVASQQFLIFFVFSAGFSIIRNLNSCSCYAPTHVYIACLRRISSLQTNGLLPAMHLPSHLLQMFHFFWLCIGFRHTPSTRIIRLLATYAISASMMLMINRHLVRPSTLFIAGLYVQRRTRSYWVMSVQNGSYFLPASDSHAGYSSVVCSFHHSISQGRSS